MDTKKIERYLNTFGMPVLTVLAGLILLVNPDGATALVTKLVGWVMVILGAGMLVRPALKNIHIAPGTWIWGGGLIVVGVLLLAKPMILADSLGRLFGTLLLIEGIHHLRIGISKTVPVLTIVAGAVLVLIPRTLTQTLLAVCGIVLIVAGAVNLLGRLNEMKRLDQGSDPNIIDADM